MTDVFESVSTDDNASPRPVVEIGWVLVGRFDKHLAKASRRARGRFARRLRDLFPSFEFRVPLVMHPEQRLPATAEATTLLDIAQNEKDLKNWDFALAVTAGDLRGYVRPTLLAAPSAVIGCAAIACGRIWEPCEEADDDACMRRSVKLAADRLANLATHLLGHLCGLRDRDEAADFMHKPKNVVDLEAMQHFDDAGTDLLRWELHDVADPRLEEDEQSNEDEASSASMVGGALRHARFNLVAAATNASDVWGAVVRAQPWMFPLRLSRLTTAAVSTLLVLCMTAEAWEAGMSQPMWRVVVLSIAAMLLTTPFLINRQQLLIHRPRRRSRRFSEQRSVGNVAISLAVFLGMLTTYTALLLAALLTTWAFFPDHVVANWAATVEKAGRPVHYFRLCGSVAAVGLVIGALGASFEPRGYMRHVALVDEEI